MTTIGRDREFARFVGFLALVLACACQTPPRDPWIEAQRAVVSGELLEALQLLDEIPPGHPAYAAARTQALAVERRVRAGQKLLATGLDLRAQWSDREAEEAFRQALDVWPECEHARALLRATAKRRRAVDGGAAGQGVGRAEVRAVETSPILTDSSDTEYGSAEPDQGPLSSGTRDGEVERAGSSQGETALGTTRRSASQAAVAHVNRLLRQGRLDDALLDLRELYSRSPSRGIRTMLVNVLHQRALVRYGQGELDQALVDWRSVRELDPNHSQARDFARAAAAELAAH